MISPRHTLAALLLLLLGVSQAAAQAKLPIPTESERTQALALIQDVYKQEYEAAKTDIQKVVLAQKLIADAKATSGNPTNRYVLLRVAKDLAGGVGHLATAYEAIDLLDAEFAVDPLQLRAETLTSTAKAAKLPSHYQALAPEFVALITEALKADRYDIPAGLKDTATDAARKTRDTALTKTVLDALARSEAQQQAFDAIQPALATLEQQPTDPVANLAVGKYRCLVLGRWDQGVPMLALGSDAALRSAAIGELEGVATATDRAALGDKWWDSAAAYDGDSQLQLQRRAAHWYGLALDGLAGLPREQARKRLLELQSTPAAIKFPEGAVLVFNFDKSSYTKQGSSIYLKDLSGLGNHGLVQNGEPVPGKVGEGFSTAPPRNGFIECKDSPSLNPTDALTVCAWVNLSLSAGENSDYFVSKDDRKGGPRGFVLRGSVYPHHAHPNLTIGASGWHQVISNSQMKLNQWQHIAATYDGEQMTMYVDGTVAGTSKVTGKIQPSPYKLRIGRGDYSSDRMMNGVIDEVALFARALSGEEIADIYRLGQIGQSIGQ